MWKISESSSKKTKDVIVIAAIIGMLSTKEWIIFEQRI